jgi:hypothetical protein
MSWHGHDLAPDATGDHGSRAKPARGFVGCQTHKGGRSRPLPSRLTAGRTPRRRGELSWIGTHAAQSGPKVLQRDGCITMAPRINVVNYDPDSSQQKRSGRSRPLASSMSRVVKRSASQIIKAGPSRRGAPLPQFVPPQLSRPVEKPPSWPQWLHEIKLDGYRMAARVDNGRVQLLTRTGLDWSNKYPNAIASLANLNVKTAYIDGELCGVELRLLGAS